MRSGSSAGDQATRDLRTESTRSPFLSSCQTSVLAPMGTVPTKSVEFSSTSCWINVEYQDLIKVAKSAGDAAGDVIRMLLVTSLATTLNIHQC